MIWVENLTGGLILFMKVSRRLNLVYGGGSVGLMGLISQEVHRGGGHVLGYVLIIIYLLLYILFSFSLVSSNCFPDCVSKHWQNHPQNTDVQRGL